MEISSPLLDTQNLDEPAEALAATSSSTVHHFPSSSKTSSFFFYSEEEKTTADLPPMDIEPLLQNKGKFSRSLSLDSGGIGGCLDSAEAGNVGIQMPATSTQPSPVKVAVGQGQAQALYSSQLSPTSTTVTSHPELRRMSADAVSDVQEQQESMMIDSSNPKSVFVPCKVCGDRASGFHYGVTSCEGCKGFFRRSIQKQIEYRCLRDGKCMVIRLNRNRCQFCRFKKCLAVGMSRESVRYGRVPRSTKKDQQPNSTTEEDASSPTPTPTTTTTPPPPEVAHSPPQESAMAGEKRFLVYELIVTVSQAHHTHCPLTVDKVTSIQRKSVSLLSDSSGVTMDLNDVEKWEEYRCAMFDSVAQLISPTIHRIVEFAKRVPGFLSLAQDSQLVLIKQGFLELWLLHTCRAWDALSHTLTFPDGSTVPRHELHLVLKRECVDEVFRLVAKLIDYELNDTELALLAAYTLAEPGRQGLLCRGPVEQIQRTIYEALELQLRQNHRSRPGLFKELLGEYSALNVLGAELLDTLAWFRARWQRMRLPPLFSEIFDIPKRNEEETES